MAMERSHGAILVFLASILCREGLCFQAFQPPPLMAHKSGFASVCSFRAVSVGAFRTAGSAPRFAGNGGRRCRGMRGVGVQGLSAKATPDYYKVRWEFRQGIVTDLIQRASERDEMGRDEALCRQGKRECVLP